MFSRLRSGATLGSDSAAYTYASECSPPALRARGPKRYGLAVFFVAHRRCVVSFEPYQPRSADEGRRAPAPRRLVIRAVESADVPELAQVIAQREGGDVGTHLRKLQDEIVLPETGRERLLLVATVDEEVVGFARNVENLIGLVDFDATTNQDVFGNLPGTVHVRGAEFILDDQNRFGWRWHG